METDYSFLNTVRIGPAVHAMRAVSAFSRNR
jgi:hypothetical protein